MKKSLKKWDNPSQSNQYCEDLAWGALTNTSTFNILFPRWCANPFAFQINFVSHTIGIVRQQGITMIFEKVEN